MFKHAILITMSTYADHFKFDEILYKLDVLVFFYTYTVVKPHIKSNVRNSRSIMLLLFYYKLYIINPINICYILLYSHDVCGDTQTANVFYSSSLTLYQYD